MFSLDPCRICVCLFMCVCLCYVSMYLFYLILSTFKLIILCEHLSNYKLISTVINPVKYNKKYIYYIT